MASYEMVCWTFSAVVALLMLLVLFLPESPIWLQQAGRYEESLASAKKLWGPEFEYKSNVPKWSVDELHGNLSKAQKTMATENKLHPTG